MSDVITQVTGPAVLVSGDDIDTDRIVPARFLRCVTFDGLGETLFYDERFTADGASRGHALDAPSAEGARVMLSGRNFGCGSSREHAPQAIVRAGFGAVIAESFAEIFAANSLALGLVCAQVSAADGAALRAAVTAAPDLELSIDLEQRRVTFSDAYVPFTIGDDARKALLEGRWDPLTELLASRAATERVYDALPYPRWSHP